MEILNRNLLKEILNLFSKLFYNRKRKFIDFLSIRRNNELLISKFQLEISRVTISKFSSRGRMAAYKILANFNRGSMAATPKKTLTHVTPNNPP